MAGNTIGASLEQIVGAVAAADDAVYTTDISGTILYANEALGRILRRSVEEIVGRNPSLFKSGLMSDGYYKRLWATINEGRVWRELITNRRSDGELYDASQTITPILDEDGAVTGFCAIQRDLTTFSELEHEVAGSRADLEAEIVRQSTVLNQVTHRAKNDLLLVAALLRLQAESAESVDPATALKTAAERVEALGTAYRAFQTGGRQVELRTLLAEFHDQWSLAIVDDPRSIDVRAGEGSVSPRLAVSLGVIAHELVTNAVKHGTGVGTGAPIVVSCSRDGGAGMTLSVENTVSAKDADLLAGAEPGLGLSVVQSLAAQHGGRVEFEIADGRVAITVALRDDPP